MSKTHRHLSPTARFHLGTLAQLRDEIAADMVSNERKRKANEAADRAFEKWEQLRLETTPLRARR